MIKITVSASKTGKIAELDNAGGEIRTAWGAVRIKSSAGIRRLTLLPDRKVFLDKITLTEELKAGIPDSELIVLKEGYQSWSYSGVFRMNEKQKKPRMKFVIVNHENPANPPAGRKGCHVSDMFVFAGSEISGRGVLYGQMPPFSQNVAFRIFREKGQFMISITWEFFCRLVPDRIIECDPVEIMEGPAEELLNDYALRIKKISAVKYRQSLKKGWCSWYYYYSAIDADIILENLKLAAHRRLKLDFFQIDDGYQSCPGDWTELKEGFSGRMEEISSEIKKAGYVPGIWLAPYIISKKSRRFHNSGWVLKDNRDNPVIAGMNPQWGWYYHALDVTNPEVQEYVKNVVRTIKYQWGFDYIKLDFMYAASLPGRRFDDTLSRAQVMKLANSIIREAAGEGTVLLGCGMPIAQAIGYVDAMRVSCDVAPYWEMNRLDRLLGSMSSLSTSGAVRNSFIRAFMDKKFWINDPDCLMLRARNTALTENQRKFLYNAVMICGGMLVFSDSLAEYGDKEFGVLDKAIEMFTAASSGNAIPLDITNHPCPEIIYNDAGYLAVFNFGDRPAEKIIDVAKLGKYIPDGTVLTEIGTGFSAVVNGGLKLSLPAHGSLMFRIK